MPANVNAIENNGAIADEAFVLDDTAVQQHAVGDGDIAANAHRHAGVAVNDGAVLHIAARADLDVGIVGAQDAIEPDTGALAHAYRADQLSARRYVMVVAGRHQLPPLEGVNHGRAPNPNGAAAICRPPNVRAPAR